MKVHIEAFVVIEGHRFLAGTVYEVDKNFQGDVDHFGCRLSKSFHETHFAQKKETKKKAEELPKKEEV